MESMSKVVASNNLKAAAENEGQALLITKTKGAEAEGNAIKIAAEAEREAAPPARARCSALPAGSGQGHERSRRTNEASQPRYQRYFIQHVDGSREELCRVWKRQRHLFRWQRRRHGKNHEANTSADGETCGERKLRRCEV